MALPAITGIAPTTGPASGGTTVLIQGTDLVGASAVQFGGVSATSISVASTGTSISATSPPGAGTANISVTTAAGVSVIVPASQFTYVAAPAAAPAAAPSVPATSGYYTDPGLTSQLVGTLVNVINSATSPDALEAQTVIMRRIALEGDVIGSRVPPPKNITEVGGYMNLLTKLKEPTMREQALAGILGVAGPNPPLGWISNTQPLAMVSLANDRPVGAAQATIPLTVLVRSDFVNAVKSAVSAVHQFGATLPFGGASVLQLPPGAPGTVPPADALKYLGRELMLASTAALVDPPTDPLVLVSAPAPAFVAANVLSPTSVTVAPQNVTAVVATPTASNGVAFSNLSLVPLAPILAAAGFYPASPLPLPANSSKTAWALFTNVTGLVSGTTRLGDELSLLYGAQAIASSVFASALDLVWNGTTFA
jgi:IPT/TIG domain